jgi:hypothetical protein
MESGKFVNGPGSISRVKSSFLKGYGQTCMQNPHSIRFIGKFLMAKETPRHEVGAFLISLFPLYVGNKER